MQIEISSAKFGLIGREGIKSFQCKLLINGAHIANVREDGNGGCLHIDYSTAEQGKLLKLAGDWIKENIKDDFVNDLDSFIIDKVSNLETEAQLKKDMKKGICWQKVGQKKGEYTITSWKRHKIEEMLTTAAGKAAIKTCLANLKSYGHVVLNTNLGDLNP